MPIDRLSDNGGSVITGNAINYFQVAVIRSGLRLYLKTGMFPVPGCGPKRMLALTTTYTGSRYPNNRKGQEQALVDLTAILDRDPDSVRPNGNQ